MICVFDIGNENFTGNGDAVLTPMECKLKNVAGGGYDLTMTHPIDPEGKWKHLVPGAVIKAPVPREEIENAFAGYAADVYKTVDACALRDGMSEPTPITYPAWMASMHTYVVGDKCTYYGRNYQCILSDPKYRSGALDMQYNHPPDNYPMYWKEISRYTAGAAVLVTLPAGAELYFVEDMDGTWYKMSTYYGIVGYIKKSQVTFYRHLSPTETQPRIITEQLFRIEKPTVDTKARTVTVEAKHVSYDLNGILVENVSIAQASPAMAIGRITEAFMMEYPGMIATNLTAEDNGTYTNTIKGKNGIFALLDPDKGIVSTFDAAFKRDNWDLFVLKRTDADSGYRIRYRKNMLGVNWAQDSSGLVTRVVPVAKDANGDDLYLPEKWIDSDRIGDYPIVRMEYLTVSGQVGKDDGTGTSTVWTEEALLEEMRTKAAERFSVDRADRVGVTVTVDFAQLGSTEEYREFRGMENVLLYDTVTVQNEEIGLSVRLYVSEWEWDAIRRKTTAVKLINAMNYMKGTVAGYNVQAKSIGSDKLTDDVTAEILSQARDMMPEYQDSGNYGPTKTNSKENAGIVDAGSGNAGKVWKTDDQGNPAWRDESGSVTVTDSDPTLSWGTRSKVGDVAGTDLHVTMPANPAPGVIDNLTSTSATDALSANQGRVLNESIGTLSDRFGSRIAIANADISDGASKTITGNSNGRALLITGGANSRCRGIYILNCTSSAATYTTVLAASDVTITASGKTLAIANGTGYTISICILNFGQGKFE